MSDTNHSVLQQAQQQFAKEGLPFPYVPAAIQSRLQAVTPWVFSTRADDQTPYDLDSFVASYLEAAEPESYLLFGHDGHGINSYAMHYYWVQKHLALFDQIAWGGVYTDNDFASKMMRVHFAQLQGVIQLVERTQASGKWPKGQRLIAVMSDFRPSRWVMFRHGDMQWVDEPSGLEALLGASLAVEALLAE